MVQRVDHPGVDAPQDHDQTLDGLDVESLIIDRVSRRAYFFSRAAG
jgi:hypothetical protein